MKLEKSESTRFKKASDITKKMCAIALTTSILLTSVGCVSKRTQLNNNTEVVIEFVDGKMENYPFGDMVLLEMKNHTFRYAVSDSTNGLLDVFIYNKEKNNVKEAYIPIADIEKSHSFTVLYPEETIIEKENQYQSFYPQTEKSSKYHVLLSEKLLNWYKENAPLKNYTFEEAFNQFVIQQPVCKK